MMNLTRRILEGIHEVELDISPEFRKPKFEPEEVVQALLANDWHEGSSPEFVAPNVELSTWVHPDIEGASFEVAIDVGKGVLARDTIIFKKGEGFESLYTAKPTVIERLTNVWVTGAARRGAAPVGLGEYPVVVKSDAVAGLIGNRVWVTHGFLNISQHKSVDVKVPPGDVEVVESVRSVLDASGLTYEHTLGVPVFRVFGSPGMSGDQINKAFTKLLTNLDSVLGGPKL